MTHTQPGIHQPGQQQSPLPVRIEFIRPEFLVNRTPRLRFPQAQQIIYTQQSPPQQPPQAGLPVPGPQYTQQEPVYQLAKSDRM